MNNEQKPQEQHTREVFADLGFSIQQLRHHHGLTVEQAAEAADTTPAKYAAERGIPLTTAANNAIATFRALRETPDLPGQKSPNQKP